MDALIAAAAAAPLLVKCLVPFALLFMGSTLFLLVQGDPLWAFVSSACYFAVTGGIVFTLFATPPFNQVPRAILALVVFFVLSLGFMTVCFWPAYEEAMTETVVMPSRPQPPARPVDGPPDWRVVTAFNPFGSLARFGRRSTTRN